MKPTSPRNRRHTPSPQPGQAESLISTPGANDDPRRLPGEIWELVQALGGKQGTEAHGEAAVDLLNEALIHKALNNPAVLRGVWQLQQLEKHLAVQALMISPCTLVTDCRVLASTYARAVEVLGHDGVVELVFLIGGYCLIAMLLNGLMFQRQSAEA